jgi:hypothetical protein
MNLTTVAIFCLNSCASVLLIAVNKVLMSRLGFVWGMLRTRLRLCPGCHAAVQCG